MTTENATALNQLLKLLSIENASWVSIAKGMVEIEKKCSIKGKLRLALYLDKLRIDGYIERVETSPLHPVIIENSWAITTEGQLFIDDNGYLKKISALKFDDLSSFLLNFKTEEDCSAYFRLNKWHNHGYQSVYCPYCKGTKIYREKENYKCLSKKCGKPFSVKIGTKIQESRTSLLKWFAAIYLFTSGGCDSLGLSKKLKITTKEACSIMILTKQIFSHSKEKSILTKKEKNESKIPKLKINATFEDAIQVIVGNYAPTDQMIEK